MYLTHFLQATESTNLDALKLARDGAGHGTAILSETQTRGRGRLGKNWSSPAGKGLYCSIIVRPELSLLDFPRITFVAGLAVAEVISQMYTLEAGLKWPNDIYFNMRKCGGILTESSGLGGPDNERFAVVGIGVNVNTQKSDFPEILRNDSTSLYLESGKKFDIEKIFHAIRRELLDQIEAFELNGFLPIISKWRKRDFMLGKTLTWVSVTGEKVVGTSMGPDDDGQLHVRDGHGVVHEVLSGDIQLATA